MKRTTRAPGLWMLTAPLIFVASAALLPAQPASDLAKRYTITNSMVAMRDGIKLNTTVYVPKDAKEDLPFIFLRTPYGIDARAERHLKSYLAELDKEGYIFVYQDIR